MTLTPMAYVAIHAIAVLGGLAVVDEYAPALACTFANHCGEHQIKNGSKQPNVWGPKKGYLLDPSLRDQHAR